MAKKKKVRVYDDLRASLSDALAFERGQVIDLRTTELPPPPESMTPEEIRRIRMRMHASQVVFARYLCVSPKAVQSWEQGVRQPQGTALRLLAIAKRRPKVLLEP
jgi:putative transcriptional regulator